MDDKKKLEKIERKLENISIEMAKVQYQNDVLTNKLNEVENKVLLIKIKKLLKEGTQKIRRKLVPESIRKLAKNIMLKLGIYTTLDLATIETSGKYKTITTKKYPRTKPLVSVVYTIYNKGPWIDDSWQSLQNQTFKDLEIIMVDDASTDDTIEKVQKLKSQVKEFHINDRNLGIGATRNNGAKLARGKYIMFLDADDTIEPTYIQKAVSLMESTPSIDFVYTHVNNFGAEERKWKLLDFEPANIYYNNFITNNAVHKKELWQEVGGYSEEKELKYEDWDYWMKIVEKGYQGQLIPEFLFNYRRITDGVNSEARSKHNEQQEYVRSRHDALKNASFVVKLKMGYKKLVSKTPFINLNKRLNDDFGEIVKTAYIVSKKSSILKILDKVDINSVVILNTKDYRETAVDQMMRITPFVFSNANYMESEYFTEYSKLLVEQFTPEVIYTDSKKIKESVKDIEVKSL